MRFFLFLFFFFPFIHNDCLEFLNNSSINKCLIKETENQDLDYYYHECLQCTIDTLIKSDNIQLETNNQCLLIDLQCIQLKFPTLEIFEDFFQNHQEFLSDLFFQNNGTDQNTLHIIIKENTLEEINADYIEHIFQIKYQVYRVLFFELHLQNQPIQINRNLLNIKRLAIKLILICGDETQPSETIYIIHNQKMSLESKEDLCSTIFIPSSTLFSNQILSKSDTKSKHIIIIIIIFVTIFFLSILIIYCFKQIKHRYQRLSKQIDTTSEISISEDQTPNEIPELNSKFKRPVRGMRAAQLLEDDV